MFDYSKELRKKVWPVRVRKATKPLMSKGEMVSTRSRRANCLRGCFQLHLANQYQFFFSRKCDTFEDEMSKYNEKDI